MHLHFSGQPEIAAPQAEVWRRLLDPRLVAACMIGVESVEAITPTRYRVISGLGVGPMKLRVALDVELHDIVEPERARMRLRGSAPGSTVDTRTAIALEALGADRTRLSWVADTEVTGTLASLGGRFVESAARMVTERFWEEFAARAAESGQERGAQ
ncbi:MAG TPA: carbon monoxide dehydrogenase subunit G [Gemmatimonadales bacterium]|nr:carbon monoxide dehydrogenase subunit G [Gemmatimonadales bacterium]